MNEQKEGQLRQDDANREPADPVRRSYWTRAHRELAHLGLRDFDADRHDHLCDDRRPVFTE